MRLGMSMDTVSVSIGVSNPWPICVEVEFRAVVQIVASDADFLPGLFQCDSNFEHRLFGLSGLNQFDVSVAGSVAVFAAVTCQVF